MNKGNNFSLIPTIDINNTTKTNVLYSLLSQTTLNINEILTPDIALKKYSQELSDLNLIELNNARILEILHLIIEVSGLSIQDILNTNSAWKLYKNTELSFKIAEIQEKYNRFQSENNSTDFFPIMNDIETSCESIDKHTTKLPQSLHKIAGILGVMYHSDIHIGNVLIKESDALQKNEFSLIIQILMKFNKKLFILKNI